MLRLRYFATEMSKGKNTKTVPAIILLLFLFPVNNFSQDTPGHKYPLGYFRNPLNIPMSLTANCNPAIIAQGRLYAAVKRCRSP